VLSNLIAGVQLGMTQPIRLEDAVTVENEFGWIEEINSTYVVIRLWDMRRLIVPLNYFSQKPFYNWTRHSATTVGNITLYLDYAAPVDVIRQKAIEFVANSESGEAKVTSVQVTNTTPQAIEVRVLVVAASTGITSNVCADVRERLIAYLQKEHPEALPRQRSESVAGIQNKNDNVSTAG
jgi:small-conductance mechanosensitive channel